MKMLYIIFYTKNIWLNCNSKHNILELYNISVQVQIDKIKKENFENYFTDNNPHEMKNDLRYKIFRNKEILEKYQA